MVKNGDTRMGAVAAGDDRYRAPALDKGLDILEVLANQSVGLTRAEIVRELGVSASQIYRMLERLVARGYVHRLDGGDRYMLSMKLFMLSTWHPPIRRLTAQAQPIMDQFARDLQQPCHLVIPQHGSGIIIAQASPISHWEFRARLGAQMDLFDTGSGLTLLAFQHPDRLRETLGQWGVADPEPKLRKVADELERVRLAGYRVAPSSQVVGITDISVPIRGPSRDAIAALTCACLQHPEDGHAANRKKALSSLVELAQKIVLC